MKKTREYLTYKRCMKALRECLSEFIKLMEEEKKHTSRIEMKSEENKVGIYVSFDYSDRVRVSLTIIDFIDKATVYRKVSYWEKSVFENDPDLIKKMIIQKARDEYRRIKK